MNIVVLLAGGKGERTGLDEPKQFIKVLDKPLIVYAMDIYEKSPYIDYIEIVSLKDYINEVWDLADQYNIKKLRWVTEGGSSCQDSIRNGIINLQGKVSDKDMIMFNMSTSIFVDDTIIFDSLFIAEKYGNAFCCMPCIYNNAETFDGICSKKIHSKETHRTINLPWTARYGKFNELYKKAYECNIENSVSSYAPNLFLALGETLYFSHDNSLNKIHITTKEDIEIVTAILEYRNKLGEKME